VAGEIDPVRVVNDTIENGVSVGGITDQLVPFVDWDLAGDDRRSSIADRSVLRGFRGGRGGRRHAKPQNE
jgi:hypothetical protein